MQNKFKFVFLFIIWIANLEQSKFHFGFKKAYSDDRSLAPLIFHWTLSQSTRQYYGTETGFDRLLRNHPSTIGSASISSSTGLLGVASRIPAEEVRGAGYYIEDAGYAVKKYETDFRANLSSTIAFMSSLSGIAFLISPKAYGEEIDENKKPSPGEVVKQFRGHPQYVKLSPEARQQGEAFLLDYLGGATDQALLKKYVEPNDRPKLIALAEKIKNKPKSDDSIESLLNLPPAKTAAIDSERKEKQINQSQSTAPQNPPAHPTHASEAR